MLLKLVALSLCVVCCVGIGFPPSRIFGNVLRKGTWIQTNHYLGSEYLRKLATKENKFTFTFPRPEKKDPNKEFIIQAIQQNDYSIHDAKAEIIKGDIGSNEVTMEVTVPQGKHVDSAFHFYGEVIPKDSAKKSEANKAN